MVMSIFNKNLFYTLQNRFFVACSSHWDKLRCRRSRRNAATKLMYVPINFYHGGALLVQRASLGDHPILRSRGGVYIPPLSQPCMAQMSPYEGLIKHISNTASHIFLKTVKPFFSMLHCKSKYAIYYLFLTIMS